MTIRVEVFDSYSAVSPPDWERLAASRSVFQELAWYQIAPPYGRLRLLTAYRGQHPIGILPLYILDSPSHYYHTPRDLFCGFRERALLETNPESLSLLREASGADWFPAVVSVCPYGYRGGLIADTQNEDVVEVADAIASTAADVCLQEGVHVAAYYYLNETDDSVWLAALARKGVQISVAGADCILEVRWSSLNAYFSALGPRGRRLRAEHRHAYRDDELQWLTLRYCDDGPDAELTRVAKTLFAGTALRHGDSDPPFSLYEKALCSWPGCRLLLAGAPAGDDFRSALLVFAKGEKLYPKFFGTNGVRGDYFILTYPLLLELAITAGVRLIEYGGGSHKAKLLRGARLRWLLAGIQVYDHGLVTPVANLLPHYDTAKVAHFSDLAARYQYDHTPPPRPFVQWGNT